MQGGVSPTGTWYVFSAVCRAVEHRGQTSSLSVSASYLPGSRLFAEEVHAAIEGSVWTARIRGRCPKDPWKTATDCEVTEVVLSPNALARETLDRHGYPLTAKLLTAEKRSELARLVPDAVAGGPGKGKGRGAEIFGPPSFVRPEGRRVYSGQVLVRIRPAPGSSESRYVLEWQLLNGRTAQWEDRPVAAQYDATAAGEGLQVTLEKLGEPGMWRLRARPASEPESWTGWVTFGLQ